MAEVILLVTGFIAIMVIGALIAHAESRRRDFMDEIFHGTGFISAVKQDNEFKPQDNKTSIPAPKVFSGTADLTTFTVNTPQSLMTSGVVLDPDLLIEQLRQVAIEDAEIHEGEIEDEGQCQYCQARYTQTENGNCPHCGAPT